MYEVVEFIEIPGQTEPIETVLGIHGDENRAVQAARNAKATFLDAGRSEYAWWIVRTVGKRVAAFIADSKSDREFVLDLTTNELVEMA